MVIRFLRRSTGASQIADFVRWAKANGVSVFATWPNTLYFYEYEHHPAFDGIKGFYRLLGVEVIGRPGDAMVSYDFLAETIYHLTAPGIALRTERLIEVLRENSAFETWRENAKQALPDDGSRISN